VVNGPLDGTRLVDVQWDGVSVMMFTLDIRERGTAIDATPNTRNRIPQTDCVECNQLQAKYHEVAMAYGAGVAKLEELLGGERSVFDEAIQRLKGFRDASASAKKVLETHRAEVHARGPRGR
jgi:hypothetical protein